MEVREHYILASQVEVYGDGGFHVHRAAIEHIWLVSPLFHCIPRNNGGFPRGATHVPTQIYSYLLLDWFIVDWAECGYQ